MKSPFDISLLAAAPQPAVVSMDPWSAVGAERLEAGVVRLRQPPEFARVLQRIFMAIPHVAPAAAEVAN